MRRFALRFAFTLIVGSVGTATGCNELERLDDEGSGGVPAPVQQAFDLSCATAGCHAATSRAGGLSLAPGDSDAVIGTPSQQAPNLPLVELGDLCGSYLAIKLVSDDQVAACGTTRAQERMPVGGVADDVTASNVAVILGWIAGTDFPVDDDGGQDSTDTDSSATETEFWDDPFAGEP